MPGFRRPRQPFTRMNRKQSVREPGGTGSEWCFFVIEQNRAMGTPASAHRVDAHEIPHPPPAPVFVARFLHISEVNNAERLSAVIPMPSVWALAPPLLCAENAVCKSVRGMWYLSSRTVRLIMPPSQQEAPAARTPFPLEKRGTKHIRACVFFAESCPLAAWIGVQEQFGDDVLDQRHHR